VSGSVASTTWTSDVGSYPYAARADAVPGDYLVALGYGGVVVLP
jgi:hypothetical protein